jgi:hypothetical protein
MNLSAFVKIQDIKRFVETIFGEKVPFLVESHESIERNLSRRAEEKDANIHETKLKFTFRCI